MMIVFRVLALVVLVAVGLVAGFLLHAPRIDKPVALNIKPGANVRAVARELRSPA
jgi:hypothetical protein